MLEKSEREREIIWVVSGLAHSSLPPDNEYICKRPSQLAALQGFSTNAVNKPGLSSQIHKRLFKCTHMSLSLGLQAFSVGVNSGGSSGYIFYLLKCRIDAISPLRHSHFSPNISIRSQRTTESVSMLKEWELAVCTTLCVNTVIRKCCSRMQNMN